MQNIFVLLNKIFIFTTELTFMAAAQKLLTKERGKKNKSLTSCDGRRNDK